MSADRPEDTEPRTAPEVCPVCGEDVPAGAAACPGCGADSNPGWNEEATAHDGLDLPDDEFDYDEFVKREFADPPAARNRWKTRAALALGLLAGLALAAVWLFGG